MNLPRHTLTSHALSPTFVNAQFHNVKERRGQDDKVQYGKEAASVRLDPREKVSYQQSTTKGKERETQSIEGKDMGTSMFACATRQGHFIARTHPLEIVSRREFSSMQGGLSHVSLVDNSSLLVLVGGGRVPRFAPNKVILWDEEATRMITVKPIDGDTSSSEGTASPLASTLFSVGREEIGLGNSRESMLASGSQKLGQEGEKSSEEDSSMEAMEIADDEEAHPSSSLEASTSASISMASSAHVDDPFGAPLVDASTPEQTSPAVKAKSAYSSSSQPPNSHIVRKGREVAELEFGEAVKGIFVKTFDVVGSESAALLVVSLNSKAVIFEMGPHIPLEEQREKYAENTARSRWGIRQRLVVEIRPGLEKGLASLAQIENTNCVLLALPGRQTGHIQLLSVALSNTSRTSIRSSIAGASTIIAGHANAISSLTLSEDAKLLCSTSERGTLLRVWSTLSSSERATKSLSTTLVGELRRGSDAAKIWSVAFSPDSQVLAAGSDKGTIHLFNLQPLHLLISPSRSASPTTTAATTPPKAGLSKRANKFLPPSVQQFANSIPPSLVPQYLKSQWSFTQFKVPLKIFSSSLAEGPTSATIPLFNLRDQQGRSNIDEQEDISSRSGKQVSLEGGWAGMRGRIDDVRKGEKGIEEGMWLTWIPANRKEEEVDATLATGRGAKRRSGPSCPFELVAITSSGSHYRIGVSAPNQGLSKAAKTTTTVLDMYKENSGTQQENDDDNDSKKVDVEGKEQSWLIEYQRFGMRDDWID